MKRNPGLLLLAAVLLAGCAGHHPRPAHGGHRARPATSGRGSGGSGGVVDDIRRGQDRRYRDTRDSVPQGPPPDVSSLPEPVPKAEPRSLYGNKSPYTVLGHTYRVLPSAHGYVERGLASFYGNKFNGYKTSSLETYDMYAFSAAHKTLPLPSYARVTNLDNGKSVVVRINDRGPFHPGRIIDLSYAAAVRIGIWPRGTGRVEVRALDPDEGGEPPAEVAVRTGSGEPIYLQVGAFADRDNAERLAERLRRARLAPVQVEAVEVDGQEVRRVRLGPLRDRAEADAVSARVERMGLPRPHAAAVRAR